MTTVYLKPHKEESLLRFHPWVFSGAIRSIQLDADYPHAQPQEGEVVQVRDSNGNILGVGHYQIGSIAVRILAFGVGELPHDFWQERICAAYEVRRSLGLITSLPDPQSPISNPQYPTNNTYRLVHGEGDFLPGLIVDIYADTAVIQAHSIGMHYHREEIAKAIVQAVPQVDKVYYKSDDTLPHKAPIQGERVGYLIGAEKADFNGDFWAKENGLDFRIDWLRGQKTGFFIDQRDNRALLEHYAQGKEVKTAISSYPALALLPWVALAVHTISQLKVLITILTYILRIATERLLISILLFLAMTIPILSACPR